MNRQFRFDYANTMIGRWVDEEHHLGRLTADAATRLRDTVQTDRDAADLVGLFAVHMTFRALKPTGWEPTSIFLLVSAVLTGHWWLVIPAMIDPAFRVVTTIGLGLWRHPWLLAFGALPTVGLGAAPLYLLNKQPELGGFMIRSLAREAALHIPGFGERGSLTEMLAVAAAQVLIVEPARLIPWVLIGVLSAKLLVWSWLGWAVGLVYGAVVIWSLVRRWHAPTEHRPGVVERIEAGMATLSSI